METYGFNKLSIRKLTDDLEPDTTSKIRVIEGKAKEGAPVTMDLTGLTKTAVKVFGGDIEYFVVRKGVGNVAANLGILDLPIDAEQEIYGYEVMAEGIDGIGKTTEPPYVAAFAESEDLYGVPVAFALTAGSLSRDGYSLATKDDSEFTPEAGESVFTAMSRSITVESETKEFHVMRAFGTTAVTTLKKAILGEDTAG